MSSSFISDITELFEDETKINILFILELFGPQNLEIVSELLNKAKSTIYGHISKMLELGQIQLDSTTTTQKRGKFYTLTPKVRKLLESTEEIAVNQNSINELGIPKDILIKRIANMQRSIGFQASLMLNLSAQYLERNIELFEDVKRHKEKLLGFYASIYELGVDSSEEYEELLEILKDFNEKLMKYDKTKKKNPKHNILMFLISTPRDKIGPQNRNFNPNRYP